MALNLPKTPARQATIRWWWRKYRGNKNKKIVTGNYFGKDMPVAIDTIIAWNLFEDMLTAWRYPKLAGGFWTYVNRYIAGTKTWSLHAFGIAGDKDPNSNKYVTNAEWGWTLFSKELVTALLNVRTNSGKQVFAWGGQWKHRQDLMHWYITCSPAALASGIDYTTVDMPTLGEEGQMITKGSKGKAVTAVQQALVSQGFALPKWGVDGDFGNETKAAVRAFQVAKDLEASGAVDGVTAAFLMPGPRGLPGVRGRDGKTPDLAEYILTRI